MAEGRMKVLDDSLEAMESGFHGGSDMKLPNARRQDIKVVVKVPSVTPSLVSGIFPNSLCALGT